MDIIITKVVAVPANIAIGLEHVKQNIGVPVQKSGRRTKPANTPRRALHRSFAYFLNNSC
jgi:hypothetical protein